MSRLKRPPALLSVLDKALPKKGQPVAFIVAGHNGSGKSSLWYERLADVLEMPLVNADRLTLSILPEADRDTRKLAVWAQRLRDNDERWQRLSQGAVRAFLELIRQERISFAFETVFSHLRRRPDGSYESKVSTLTELQQAGYFVVLLFVGLANVDLSIARVATRLQLGGHDVPTKKLLERFPRTQRAIGYAAPIADLTIMLDNSRGLADAFTLARAQAGQNVLFDCRDTAYNVAPDFRNIAPLWLNRVVDFTN